MMLSEKMSLGKRIMVLRKRLDLSSQEFAEQIGIHSRHLSRLEHDHQKPSPKTLSRMATVLRVSVDELVEGTDAAEELNDPVLLRAFRQAQQLDDDDKKTVLNVVQAFLMKKRMAQVIQPEL